MTSYLVMRKLPRMLNTSSPIPLYHQIADALLADIRTGRYAVGTRIPGETDLAGQYKVGRPTVRQATELLVRRGILRRQRGSGTFVAQPPQAIDLFSGGGTLSSFDRSIDDSKHSLISPVRLNKAQQRQVEPGTTVDNPLRDRPHWHFQRLTEVAGSAVLLETFHLDAQRFPDFHHLDLENRSVSELVYEHYRLQPGSGKQFFEVAQPNALDSNAAARFGQDSALLRIHRLLDFVPGTTDIYVNMLASTAQFSFSHTFQAS